jgi:hypothetical protein
MKEGLRAQSTEHRAQSTALRHGDKALIEGGASVEHLLHVTPGSDTVVKRYCQLYLSSGPDKIQIYFLTFTL